MSNHNLLCVLILAQCFFTILAAVSKENAVCGDCRSSSKDNCIIESESGYSAFAEHTLESSNWFKKDLTNKHGTDPLITADLDLCIPLNMSIKVLGGSYAFICVWSPALGCQIIFPKSFSKVMCGQCRIENMALKHACPCKKPQYPIIVKKSGARPLYSRALCIFIGAYSVQQMFYVVKLMPSNYRYFKQRTVEVESIQCILNKVFGVSFAELQISNMSAKCF